MISRPIINSLNEPVKVVAHRLLLSTLFFTILSGSCLARGSSGFDHPRGLVRAAELPVIRERVGKAPYATILKKMQTAVLEEAQEQKEWTSYEHSSMALRSAQIYLLTGERSWAERSRTYVEQILQDTVYFLNPIGRGLTKADQLLKIMMAYDYCYDAWAPDFRKQFSRITFDAILGLSANMGTSANYNMSSNWMGVRYGTVLYSAMVWDDYEAEDPGKSKIKPFLFDATKRVSDFALANIHPGGWNVESMGYHSYGWSFVMPALAAWTHNNQYPIKNFNYYDRLMRSFRAFSTFSVPIKRGETVGLKPDFSDDGTAATSRLLPYVIYLAPEAQKPYFRWVNRYFNDRKSWELQEDGGFESILYDDLQEASQPPPEDWLQLVDRGQGMVVARNRFQDENDIIAGFTATAFRQGHQGGDNLSFRLIGLGNLWAIGSGRTGQVAGQSSFFTEVPAETLRHDRSIGQLKFAKLKKGEMEAAAAGSCTGVEGHERTVKVTFEPDEDTPALIRIKDVSRNGKIWRLNTPEFNEVELTPKGFILTAPNGHQLIGRVKKNKLKDYRITTGKLRYGGKTVRHNYGIYFQDKQYTHSKYIDIECSGSIEVELVLK